MKSWLYIFLEVVYRFISMPDSGIWILYIQNTFGGILKEQQLVVPSYSSECSSDESVLKLFKFGEWLSDSSDSLERIRRAIFSAATALVSMVLAAFSNAFT